MNTQFLPIHQVFPNPNQPRKVFKKESLLELAKSIKVHRMIQPIIVEKSGDGYMIVAGERRWLAHQLAGMKTIEAVIRVRSNHNGREILLSAVIENVQREDMNPMDEAAAYQELIATHGMSVSKVSEKIGVNEARVYNMLKLLKLHQKVQALIRDGRFTHDARVTDALLRIPNHDMQVALVERAVRDGLKIKTIIRIAAQLADALNAKSIAAQKSRTPSLMLAYPKKDEEEEPPKWDALAQIGKLPAWSLVVNNAKKTCENCELRDMANRSTCGRCPSVVLLEGLLEDVREAVI